MSDSTGAYLYPIAGSFSEPAGDNPTGILMNAAFDAAGISAIYANCEVPPDNLRDAVAGARAMNWIGFNCSMPHKVSVINLLDGLGSSAALIGAVNCVRRSGDQFIGENTDGRGFLESLAERATVEGRMVTVLGAGGAARAIAVELGLAGADRVQILSRNAAAGRELAEIVSDGTRALGVAVAWTPGIKVDQDCDILVNATSVGMDGVSSPDVDLDDVVDAIVGDVVISPTLTPFLIHARERGLPMLDGLGMLVNQAALSLEYWFGLDADKARMRHELEAALG